MKIYNPKEVLLIKARIVNSGVLNGRGTPKSFYITFEECELEDAANKIKNVLKQLPQKDTSLKYKTRIELREYHSFTSRLKGHKHEAVNGKTNSTCIASYTPEEINTILIKKFGEND